MFFWNSLAFFHDPADVGNLISGSSAFSKTSLNIRKFTVHVLLKPGLENFEHYCTSVGDECNCVVVWAFFGTAFLWDWISVISPVLKKIQSQSPKSFSSVVHRITAGAQQWMCTVHSRSWEDWKGGIGWSIFTTKEVYFLSSCVRVCAPAKEKTALHWSKRIIDLYTNLYIINTLDAAQDNFRSNARSQTQGDVLFKFSPLATLEHSLSLKI